MANAGTLLLNDLRTKMPFESHSVTMLKRIFGEFDI